ncbi:YcnI family protein [Geodermatophilus sp. CPCC 205761]|uniref:YcnI family protein n=1 Tax=Geodermatophilus sp. CPCC 205761 TaxID=2936597 RepID=UPI003EF003DF
MSTSLPRPLARLGVVVPAVLVALAAAVAGAGVASAHVTVSSADAAPGGFGKLTFRVPNESDTASTVALRISVPEESALASLRVQPIAGWTVTMTTSDLATPLESHGEQITSYVSVIEFRAVDGGGIRPGEFQEFALSGGPFPESGELTFPAVQTYSDGTEAAWIEPTVDGRPEPERPAPVLALGGGTSGSAGATEPASSGGDTATSSDGDTATSSDGDTASSTESVADEGSSTGTVALVLSIVALLLGLGGVALGLRAGRRTVSS